jgi:Spy/CpxP family protein refolding chaperone
MKSRFLVTSVLALATFGSLVAQESRAEQPKHHRGAFGEFKTLHQLNLTDAQKQQIKEILRTNRDALRAARASVWEARKQVELALQANPNDEAALRSKAAQLSTATTEMLIKRAQIRAQVVTMLTPEQLQQWNQLQDQRRQQREERIKRWREESGSEQGTDA